MAEHLLSSLGVLTWPSGLAISNTTAACQVWLAFATFLSLHLPLMSTPGSVLPPLIMAYTLSSLSARRVDWPTDCMFDCLCFSRLLCCRAVSPCFSTTLFVGRINVSTRQTDIEDLFGKYGRYQQVLCQRERPAVLSAANRTEQNTNTATATATSQQPGQR